MKNIKKIVLWIRKNFKRKIIMEIIARLILCLEEKDNLSLKEKTKFKQEHPHYREFPVDPNPPFKYNTETGKRKTYKTLLEEYKNKHNKIIKPVKPNKEKNKVPENISCPYCKAPHNYLYYNNGKQRSQFQCKICEETFTKNTSIDRHKYLCPHCGETLHKWKKKPNLQKYKCENNDCSYRKKKIEQLTSKEKKLRKKEPSHFKVHYSYTEYNYKPSQLKIPEIKPPPVDLTKIHSTMNILGLVLTFYISYGLSSRKTALILMQVFSISISHQTVLNYVTAAGYYCHNFNLKNKTKPDPMVAGDETYLKLSGEQFYTWFAINSTSKSISAYHLSNSRETKHAITTIKETIRTADENQEITFVSDGNPSYLAAVKYLGLELDEEPQLELKNVVGLENKDEESEEYRKYKQIIERLNRTYKYHLKPGTGFSTFNTAFAHLSLFVTHYNYLRPHSSIGHHTPIHVPELDNISNIQGRWTKIISMAA